MADSRSIMGRSVELSLKGLFGEKYLSDLQKNLSEATGISFFIIDYKGSPVTDHDSSNLFCSSREKQDEFYRSCQMSYALAAAKSAIHSIPMVFNCPSGLVNIAIPVIVKDQYLGALIGGPLYCEDSEDEFELVSTDISKDDFAVHDLPQYGKARLMAVASLVYRLFGEIGEKQSVLIDSAKVEHNLVHYEALRQRNKELTERVRQLEFANLRMKFPSQIFLNMMTSLSNIAIMENAEKTETLLSEFSGILRFYLQESAETITVENELHLVEKYMNVLKQQFDNTFDYRINCQNIMESQRIPVFSLMPFVIYMLDSFLSLRKSGGRFFIDVEQKGSMCRISMQMDYAQSGKKGKMGVIADRASIEEELNAVRRRLEYEYGAGCSIASDSERTIIEFPMAGGSR